MDQTAIDRAYLEELKLKSIFPDFKKMGRQSMIAFICSNWHPAQKKNIEDYMVPMVKERPDIGLEILCMETYLGLQEALKRSVVASPSSKICISSEVA